MFPASVRRLGGNKAPYSLITFNTQTLIEPSPVFILVKIKYAENRVFGTFCDNENVISTTQSIDTFVVVL